MKIQGVLRGLRRLSNTVCCDVQIESVATFHEHDSYAAVAPTDSITVRRVPLSRGFAGSASAYLLQNGPDTSQSRDSAHVCTLSRDASPLALPSFPPTSLSLLSLPPTSSLPSFSLARPLHCFFSDTNFLDCDTENGTDALCARGVPVDSAPLQR